MLPALLVHLIMLRIFIMVLLLPFCGIAQGYPITPTNYVTDGAQVLRDDEEISLNAILRSFEDSTSIQLFVYTASSLNGLVIADLCQEISHNWKIGNKKTNNGVLIGIFVNDHKFRIHTGYGMEGVLPDLLTKRIQDEFMRPYFKQNDYYNGIYSGVNKIQYYSKNEYEPEKEEAATYWQNVFYGYLINFIMLSIFLFLLFSKNSDQKRSTASKITLTVIAVILSIIPCIGSVVLGFMFLFFIKSRRGSGSYTSSGDSTWYSSSSSSSSSYDSGSIFDGGGGGDSGGGGSDSSW